MNELSTNQSSAVRRPIAVRQSAWAKALARSLARRGCSANTISFLGLIAGILSGALFASTSLLPSPWPRIAWLLGAALVQARLLANMLDGMVAIESGKRTRLGEVWNEVPDRVSDAATLIGLGYAAGSWPVMGFVAALLAVFTAHVRVAGTAAGAPADFRGPMAKPHRMFIVTVAAVVAAFGPQDWMTGHEFGVLDGAFAIIIIGSAWTATRRLVRLHRFLSNAAGKP